MLYSFKDSICVCPLRAWILRQHGVKHAAIEYFNSTAVYLQGHCGQAVPAFSKVTCIYLHSMCILLCQSECIRCVFRKARVILSLGPSLASAEVRQCLYGPKPGSHQVETSLLSCSQPAFLSAFFHQGQWCWWHNPQVTAASPLCFTVMRPGSRAKGAVANNVELSASGQTRLGNQVQQVLTLQSNHSILIHLLSKHWLWEWHLLLYNQRKCYSKHHKKATFIWRGLCVQYMVTQHEWDNRWLECRS